MKLDQMLEKKIVSSIATMDRRMLDVLLPDNGAYDDTYKEVWLAKLFAMYDECLLAGEESLTIYERICDEQQHKLYGQKVYIFCAPRNFWCLMIGFVEKGGHFMGLNQYMGFKYLRKEKWFDPSRDVEMGLDFYSNELIGYVETEEHRTQKKAIIDFEKDMKNNRRIVIGRRWLLMMTQKYNDLYQQTLFDDHCEEVAMFNKMMADFNNLYHFTRNSRTYLNLYGRYKELAGKGDKSSVFKRRKLIAQNMLAIFSVFTNRYFGMNEKQEFTYSYQIDKKKYSVKLLLKDTKIDVAGYFPFMKEAKDVIAHCMEVYCDQEADRGDVHSIEEMQIFFKGKVDTVLKLMDA